MTKVLIVDDEPDVELLITQAFKRRAPEFEFSFARDGKEALERIAADPSLDLIVTDINMPVMDGLVLLSKLNQLEDRTWRAVILSAYGDMQNIRAAMNRGAFDFLTKPIDFGDFEVTLRRTRDAVESARAGAEARAQLVALEQELEIAARIQSSILPREFFPERTDFQIWAEMQPARQVGGDFYDCFLLDDQRLAFLIGDVSGKGIPAAMFMAVSRTLLRATGLQGVLPAQCLTYANSVLGLQGEPGVFVTVFYAILHTGTGMVEFAIGGHNPPYRVPAAGNLEAVDEPGGMVVGLMPEAEYETGHLQLSPGDTLFLYTDGVTEAMNPEQKFFGERRMREALAQRREVHPRDSIAAVAQAVGEFTTGAAQSDDITMLAVRWTPAAGSPQSRRGLAEDAEKNG